MNVSPPEHTGGAMIRRMMSWHPRQNEPVFVTVICPACNSLHALTLPRCPRFGDFKMVMQSVTPATAKQIKVVDGRWMVLSPEGRPVREADRYDRFTQAYSCPLTDAINEEGQRKLSALMRGEAYPATSSFSRIASLITCPLCKKSRLRYVSSKYPSHGCYVREDCLYVDAVCPSCDAPHLLRVPYHAAEGKTAISVESITTTADGAPVRVVDGRWMVLDSGGEPTREPYQNECMEGVNHLLTEVIDKKDQKLLSGYLAQDPTTHESLSRIISLITCPLCKKSRLRYTDGGFAHPYQEGFVFIVERKKASGRLIGRLVEDLYKINNSGADGESISANKKSLQNFGTGGGAAFKRNYRSAGSIDLNVRFMGKEWESRVRPDRLLFGISTPTQLGAPTERRAKRFMEAVRTAYDTLHPEYGAGTSHYARLCVGFAEVTNPENFAHAQMFFGPRLVTKLGKGKLLSAPAKTVTMLRDGGVYVRCRGLWYTHMDNRVEVAKHLGLQIRCLSYG